MFARPFGGKLGGQATGQTNFTVGYGLTADGSTTTGGGKYYYCYGTEAGSSGVL